jgi:hypothetical protein
MERLRFVQGFVIVLTTPGRGYLQIFAICPLFPQKVREHQGQRTKRCATQKLPRLGHRI